MTFTVALSILVIGIFIGYRLHQPLERLKALYRRRTYKPAILRPWTPGESSRPASTEASRHD